MREDLERLRARIDELDSALLDLLVERMRCVGEIAELKRSDETAELALRPAREARILRRLVARAGSAFPPDTLVQIWRELFAAALRAQGPVAVAVCPGELWSVARDHFGVATRLIAVTRPARALGLLEEGRAQLVLLQAPGEEDDWWWELAEAEPLPLRVLARLPFLCGPGREVRTPALLLGQLPLEPTGEDLSLLAVGLEEGTSRSRLAALLHQAELRPRWFQSRYDQRRARSWHLVEVEGFHDGYSGRLHQALAPLGARLVKLACLGAYPRPLELEGIPG